LLSTYTYSFYAGEEDVFVDKYLYTMKRISTFSSEESDVDLTKTLTGDCRFKQQMNSP